MSKSRSPLVELFKPKNWNRIHPAFLIFLIAIIALVVGTIIDMLEFLIGGAAIIIAVYTAYLALKIKD